MWVITGPLTLGYDAFVSSVVGNLRGFTPAVLHLHELSSPVARIHIHEFRKAAYRIGKDGFSQSMNS